MKIILILLAIFATLVLMDFIWLGIITKNFIISEFGSLIKVSNGSIEIKLLAGILAWLAISAGVLIFAVLPYNELGKVAMMGAIFGFLSYSIFDLTNLTFITNYSLKFTIVDILWGTFLCASIASVGFYIKGIL